MPRGVLAKNSGDQRERKTEYLTFSLEKRLELCRVVRLHLEDTDAVPRDLLRLLPGSRSGSSDIDVLLPGLPRRALLLSALLQGLLRLLRLWLLGLLLRLTWLLCLRLLRLQLRLLLGWRLLLQLRLLLCLRLLLQLRLLLL